MQGKTLPVTGKDDKKAKINIGNPWQKTGLKKSGESLQNHSGENHQIVQKKRIVSLSIKGTVQQDFLPTFFHHSNQPRPLIKNFKYFRF